MHVERAEYSLSMRLIQAYSISTFNNLSVQLIELAYYYYFYVVVEK